MKILSEQPSLLRVINKQLDIVEEQQRIKEVIRSRYPQSAVGILPRVVCGTQRTSETDENMLNGPKRQRREKSTKDISFLKGYSDRDGIS